MKQFNNSTIPVVFFGSSHFVIPIIESLRKKFDLSLVVTTEKYEHNAVPFYCTQNNIEYISVSNLSDKTIRYTLYAIRCDVAVLAYFGLILPQNILDIFPKGIINVHPSLLPKYRGSTPGQAAILNGDTTTGVTIIKLDKNVDHGPILVQKEEKILPSDTSETLYTRLFGIGAQLLEENLPQYIEGKLQLQEQDHTNATYTDHLTRQSGYFDINNPPSSDKLESMIRAYYPWPGVWATIRVKNKDLRIKILPEKKLQVEGKKPVNYKDFFNGYPEAKQILGKL